MFVNSLRGRFTQGLLQMNPVYDDMKRGGGERNNCNRLDLGAQLLYKRYIYTYKYTLGFEVSDYHYPLMSGWLGDIGRVSSILFREIASSHFERLGAGKYETIGLSSIVLRAIMTWIFVIHCLEVVSSDRFGSLFPDDVQSCCT